MSALTATLRQAGFSELACQFSALIARIDNSDELVAVTAALLSDAVSHGHVCLNLAVQPAQYDALSDYLPETTTAWIARLKVSKVVGKAGEYVPMILTDNGLLYLHTIWQAEQQIANTIAGMLTHKPLISPDDMRQYFLAWNTDAPGIHWQKIALLTALTRKFSVIAGGPGTGKTTIITHLLALLTKQLKIKIALAAPTGKAAARLQQVAMTSGLEAKTLHRLLGIDSYNQQGRYHHKKRLPVDVLIVDEASMIDVQLMAKLMTALPQTARLVLLGDSEQLGSVEAGAVLASLCEHKAQFSADFCRLARKVTDATLEVAQDDSAPLVNSIVHLTHNYRFSAGGGVGRLASAVKSGDISSVHDALQDAWQQQLDRMNIETGLVGGYQPYFEQVTQAGTDAANCLRTFERYRILCALNQGAQSVSAVNNIINAYLQRQGWHSGQRFYHGRSIIILKNDYQQHLFDGDTGLILADKQGKLRAYFLADSKLRSLDPIHLPLHETCFAMTIHKSQGSEFDRVAILLPEQDSPLLDRQLLYTAITRAKTQVMLFATDAILSQTVSRQHQRTSGLNHAINSLTSGG